MKRIRISLVCILALTLPLASLFSEAISAEAQKEIDGFMTLRMNLASCASPESALAKIEAYAAEHFSENALASFTDEEKLMKACGFSGYEAHKQRHKEFVQTITQVLRGFDEMTVTLGFDFADYLRDWILSHIACEDKQYCPIMRSFYHTLQEYSQRNHTSGSTAAPQA